jgi:hypothetical protein
MGQEGRDYTVVEFDYYDSSGLRTVTGDAVGENLILRPILSSPLLWGATLHAKTWTGDSESEPLSEIVEHSRNRLISNRPW